MHEHQLAIASEGDLVILTARSLALFITELRSTGCVCTLPIETFLPPRFAAYLQRVITSNRKTRHCFRFAWLDNQTIDGAALVKIVCRQLSALTLDDVPCIVHVSYQANHLTITATTAFAAACRERDAVFFYAHPDGHRLRIEIE